MRIHVFAKDVTLDPSVTEYIERRLGFALGRFASRVMEVAVRLRDVNGPRGGIDHECRIEANITPSARKTVRGKGESVEAAIRQAVERIARAVQKDLARRRTRRVRAGRRVVAPALA